MGLGKFASIIPMEFNASDGSSRTEDFIVYFNDNWEDLPCMLEAPLEFLRGQQFVWTQEAAASVPWQLLTPLSATIECAYGSLEAFILMLTVLAKPIGAASGGELVPLSEPVELSAGTTATALTMAQLQIFAGLLAGSFAVLFNTYTTSIRVLYFPPTAEAVLKANEARGGNRYTAGFIGPTLIRTTTAFGFSASDLHLDLANDSSRMRADFITGFLEEPLWLTTYLNRLAASGDILTNTFELVPGPGPIAPSGTPGAKIDPATTFTTRSLDAAPGPGATDLQKFLYTYDVYPELEAHNLSEAVLTAVCNTSICIEDDANLVSIGQTITESYMRTLYDPAAVIKKPGLNKV